MGFKGMCFGAMAFFAALSPNFASAADPAPALLRLGVGGFDLMDNGQTWEIDANYRFATNWWIFHPHVGFLGTGKGATYGYGGIAVDLNVTDWFVTEINFAAGGYNRGNGKSLGGVVNFRSGALFNYRMENKARIGLGIWHISNAGIYKNNPGEETVLLTYGMPF